jgi:signal transduction histidine kinase
MNGHSAKIAPVTSARETAPRTAEDDSPGPTTDFRARYAEIAMLAGGLAHEIRNPLSTMRLNLDLLAEEFENPEERRERRILQKIERVRGEAHRLERILEDFLRFARVQPLQRDPTDLNSVVDSVRDFIEPQALAQGVIVRTHYASDLPRVPLDAELFKQAILNLILNALHAMAEGGELIVSTRRENGDGVILEMVDTGVGIAPELQVKVFEAFFSTRKEGSGLGLPTARKIVETHGGRIALESEPGRGTKFTIRLPAV